MCILATLRLKYTFFTSNFNEGLLSLQLTSSICYTFREHHTYIQLFSPWMLDFPDIAFAIKIDISSRTSGSDLSISYQTRLAMVISVWKVIGTSGSVSVVTAAIRHWCWGDRPAWSLPRARPVHVSAAADQQWTTGPGPTSRCYSTTAPAMAHISTLRCLLVRE